MAKARGKRSVKGDLDELMAFTGEAETPAENPPLIYAEPGGGLWRDWGRLRRVNTVPVINLPVAEQSGNGVEQGALSSSANNTMEGDAVKKPSEPLPMVSIRAKGWVIGALKLHKAATNQTFGQMLEEYVEKHLPEEAEMAKRMFGEE